MTTASYNDIPDGVDPFEDLIKFLSLFELYKSDYIEFALNLDDYYRKIIADIDKNKVNLTETQYDKYVRLITNKINTLDVPKFPIVDDLLSAVNDYDDWTKIKSYTLKLFLFFDRDSILYHDLNLNFINAGELRNERGNKIMKLQELFYQAAFSLSIEEIKLHLNNKIEFKEGEKYFPEIFIDRVYFNIFKDFLSNYLITPYNDISYIYQKMLSQKYIHYISHQNFLKWLIDENFISKDVYNDIYERGNLLSLKKSSSKKREEIFNKLSLKHLA
ncbi:hypothetical protein RXV94_09200 [Yeosuana sp. MJ-SS3]|uniref:Uncharacterized protein n=1 Tax=Gilvirhabdus luticola TaxID=3079858 RepID=A0ABU3U8B6_9FLAO|nr:hypothetical protein [Yeosuana sp. MJ-SS3]MDU8886335.1 hypothetical protein [Yeosuana sp. MJ-SS3]